MAEIDTNNPLPLTSMQIIVHLSALCRLIRQRKWGRAYQIADSMEKLFEQMRMN